MKKGNVLKQIHERMFIGVVRESTVENTLHLADAFIEGGITVLEVSAAGANPIEIIRRLKERYGDSVIVGAGTVLDDITARIMIMAGADYIAAPTFRSDVLRICNRYGIFYMPACFTSNEIAAALDAGIEIIKLYPGEILGVGGAVNMKKMFPNLEVIAAGGANYDNMEQWLGIDVWAIGVVLPGMTCAEVKKESARYVEKYQQLKK